MYINLNSSAVFLLSTEIIIHIADTYNNRLGVMMSEYAKHKIQHEILIGGGSNAFFNGIIAWLTLREGPSLTWLGSSSFVVDITATAFILPFIVALIVIPLQKKKLQKGAAETINFGPKSLLQHWVNRLPDATFLNAIIFGVIGVLIAAPTPLIILYSRYRTNRAYDLRYLQRMLGRNNGRYSCYTDGHVSIKRAVFAHVVLLIQ